MKRVIPISTLFPGIGDALLTDGWERHARKPDSAISRMALDIAQAPARRIVSDLFRKPKL